MNIARIVIASLFAAASLLAGGAAAQHYAAAASSRHTNAVADASPQGITDCCG
jgi:hypothetical protein